MILSRLLKFVISVSLPVLVTACSLELGPSQPRIAATYAAVQSADKALPVTRSDGDTQWTLLGDTLSFLPNGRVRRIIVFRYINPGIPENKVYRTDNTQPYKIDGSRLTLLPGPCPPNASCIGPVEGEISATRLTLPFSVAGNEPLKFERLPLN